MFVKKNVLSRNKFSEAFSWSRSASSGFPHTPVCGGVLGEQIRSVTVSCFHFAVANLANSPDLLKPHKAKLGPFNRT